MKCSGFALAIAAASAFGIVDQPPPLAAVVEFQQAQRGKPAIDLDKTDASSVDDDALFAPLAIGMDLAGKRTKLAD
jgi:hypothetical protein